MRVPALVSELIWDSMCHQHGLDPQREGLLNDLLDYSGKSEKLYLGWLFGIIQSEHVLFKYFYLMKSS